MLRNRGTLSYPPAYIHLRVQLLPQQFCTRMASRYFPTVEVAPQQGPAAAASPTKSPDAASEETTPRHTSGADPESLCLANDVSGDVPADLRCAGCGLVPKRPLVTKCCSKVYSQACLKNATPFSPKPERGGMRPRANSAANGGVALPMDMSVVRGKPRTPCCFSEMELLYEADPERERRVGLLEVKCGNTDCEWVGPVSAVFGEHAATCEHVKVRCEVCERLVKRGEPEFHVRNVCRNRLVQCPLCNKEGTFAEIAGLDAPFTQKHRCTKALTTCPNRCRGSRKIERGLLVEHLKVCPLQNMDCEFKSVGCDARLNRKLLAKHMKDGQQEHLLMLVNSFHTKMCLVQSEMDFLKQGTNDPTLHASLACMTNHVKMGQLRLDCIGDAVTFRLTNYDHLSQFSEDDGKWESPPFYFASDYRMQLVAYPAGHGGFTGQALSVYLNVSKPEVGSSRGNANDAGWPMDCAYTALQVSILPQVNHSSRSHPETDETQLMMPKPVSFTAHVCHVCRHRDELPTIPEDHTQTTAEVAAKEDFVMPESLTEAGFLFQDSLVFRIEQILCKCTTQ